MLLGDVGLVERLLPSVIRHFCKGRDIYSQIDFMGVRRNRNMLRWAVIPFLYAASEMGRAGTSTAIDLT
jgi:hypothetical protein